MKKSPISDTEDPDGPTTPYIAGAVFLTVVFGLLFFLVEIEVAKEYYRKEHALPDVQVSGFFGGTSTESASVSVEMLGTKTALILIAIALVYSILLHPLLVELRLE